MSFRRPAFFFDLDFRKTGERISHFEPHLYDSKGVEIELDIKKMRKTYIESEKVVFPNVKKGCVLELRIEFFRKHTYYYSWYELFDHDIPVRIGRFIHAGSPSGKYEYKVYESRFPFEEGVYNKGRTKTWTIQEYEPPPNIGFLDYKANTEPRIMVKLTKVTSWNKTFNTRKKIFRGYKNECFGVSRDITGEDFSKTVKSCIGKEKDPMKRARSILSWVQDNVTQSGYTTDRFNDILKTEDASDLQISCLCQKMFQSAGIASSVVITGHKSYYVIDPDFLVHSEYFTTPLVIATINNKTYAAYPLRRGYEFGEYPTSYNGVYCLNLAEKKVHTLPAPKWGTIWKRKRRVLDLNSFPGKYRFVYEFKQNSASDYRDSFLGEDKSALTKKFESWLDDYNESNKLISYDIINLDTYDKPLHVMLHFQNDEMPIPYGNKKIFKLNSFFYNYFKDVTASRTEDVFLHTTSTLIDEVEVLKMPGKKVTFDMKMDNSANALFKVNFSKSTTDSSYIFCREVTYKPGKIEGKNVPLLVPDITTLNDIKNSSIIISAAK